MKEKLLNYLYCGHSFCENEDELKYKFLFLKSIVVIAVLIAIFMSVKRFSDGNIALAIVDGSFSVVLMILLYALKQSKNYIEIISHIMLFVTFVLITLVFALANNESTRIALFFIFIASVIFLKGRLFGLYYMIALQSVIFYIHFFSNIVTNYTNIDLLLIFLYSIIFYTIISLYETIRNLHHNIFKKLLTQIHDEKEEVENLKRELEINNEHLEEQVESRIIEIVALNKEVRETQKEIIFTMGAIGENRCLETGNHVKRVAEYSKELALHIGMHEYNADLLKQASPMHDIGKVGIPDAILNKPGKLDADEWKIMKTHAGLGYEMLKHSNKELLRLSAKVANEHHEKWDGSGYPNGLKGEEISIEGRITAIADVFDALGSDRVYKEAWSDEKIFKMFEEEKGKHFDPELMDIFLRNIDDFLSIRKKFVD